MISFIYNKEKCTILHMSYFKISKTILNFSHLAPSLLVYSLSTSWQEREVGRKLVKVEPGENTYFKGRLCPAYITAPAATKHWKIKPKVEKIREYSYIRYIGNCVLSNVQYLVFELLPSPWLTMSRWLALPLVLLWCCCQASGRMNLRSGSYTSEDKLRLRDEVSEMFHHAYQGYLDHAYPYDELRCLPGWCMTSSIFLEEKARIKLDMHRLHR